MGLFGKLFKKEKEVKTPRGFYSSTVKKINRLTPSSVEIIFSIPEDNKESFSFIPGQYITVLLTINEKEERRSYSICSETLSTIAVAVKEVKDGLVSTYINNELKEGDSILISKPEGRFRLSDETSIVAIAAGSGITPFVSMAYEIERRGTKMNLLYANKTESEILFKERLDQLSSIQKQYFLTQEKKSNYREGRITKESFIDFIKEDLSILKSDGFFICGPEQMIHGVKDALEMFGVKKEKIHFELFSTNIAETANDSPDIDFKGVAKVKVLIDDESHEFEMNSTKTILDAAIAADIDAPYSCRGGVCSTCRAKLIKGTVKMNINYTLTDKEIEQGFILTCQSHPTSDDLIVSYDE